MLTKKWYGFSVADHDYSFNDGRGMMFPFWSAEPITEIMSITCLSKYMRAW